MNIRKKCVVVGDEEAGKIELLVTYTTDKYPEVYVPTYFGNYVADVMIGGKTYELALWDTSKQEGYDRLRPLSYPDTDVFVMCFSIASPDSFENVREKVTMVTYTCTPPSLLQLSLYPTQWYPEVTHFRPKTPIVLVGTHLELREDEETLEMLERQHQTPISYRQGLQLQKKMGAVKYVECSARTLKNVRKVFNEAVLATTTTICPICKKKIKAACQEVIFCEGECDTRIHRKCAQLSKSEFKDISSTDEPFCCPRCRNSMEQQAPQPSKKEADETSQPSPKKATETPQPSSNNEVTHNTTSTCCADHIVKSTTTAPFSEPSSAEQSSEEQTVLNDPRDVLGKVLICSV